MRTLLRLVSLASLSTFAFGAQCAHGNICTHNFAPEIVLTPALGDDTDVTNAVGVTFVDPGVTCTDTGGAIATLGPDADPAGVLTLSIQGTIYNSVLEEQFITYSCTDGEHTVTATRTVKHTNEGPTIEIAGPGNESFDYGSVDLSSVTSRITCVDDYDHVVLSEPACDTGPDSAGNHRCVWHCTDYHGEGGPVDAALEAG